MPDWTKWFLPVCKGFPLLIENQFPIPCNRVVTQDIDGIVITLDLEVPMIRRKPSIEDFLHLDFFYPKPQVPGRFLTPVSGIALHLESHGILSLFTPTGLKIGDAFLTWHLFEQSGSFSFKTL